MIDDRGTILGVDLGERRVGLAVAGSGAYEARPLATVRRARRIADDVAALGRIVAEQHITEIVVGLPLEANGDAGPMATAARTWGDAIAAGLGLPVTYRDERLSSHLAEQRVGPIGRGRSGGPPSPAQREAYRGKVDREAAAIILQDELEARRVSRPLETPAHPTEDRPR